MKNRLKLLLGIGLVMPLFVMTPIMVVAQEDAETVETTSTEENQETNRAELKARLDARKEALKTRLTAAKQARIKSRCKASQGNLSSISGRIKGLETSRSQVYANIADRLTRLSEKLKTHNVDTAELDTEIAQLETLVVAFNEDLAAYKQAVTDLAEMDCATDPEAFQASLEAARTARSETAESAKAIRAYLTDTIKPTIGELRQQFAENASESTDTDTENESETSGGENE